LQLAVGDSRPVRGWLQQILADLPGMSMPAGKSSPPHAAVPTAGDAVSPAAGTSPSSPPAATAVRTRELGGPAGPEPTRFGDWEKNGRCIDF
jgi:homeobox protein ESX1